MCNPYGFMTHRLRATGLEECQTGFTNLWMSLYKHISIEHNLFSPQWQGFGNSKKSLKLRTNYSLKCLQGGHPVKFFFRALAPNLSSWEHFKVKDFGVVVVVLFCFNHQVPSSTIKSENDKGRVAWESSSQNSLSYVWL